jgi:hypothetical protein
MVDFAALTEKLAGIRASFSALVEKINTAAAGEAFYARITLEDRHLTGLIENLQVNQYKILFDFTEEKVIDKEIVREKASKEIEFEKLKGIEPFQTLSGKPMSIGDKK